MAEVPSSGDSPQVSVASAAEQQDFCKPAMVANPAEEEACLTAELPASGDRPQVASFAEQQSSCKTASVANSAEAEARFMAEVPASCDSPQVSAASTAEQQNSCDTVSVAVIGAGTLGKRIVAEFLLLGWRVRVYDHALAQQGSEVAQRKLKDDIWGILRECVEGGLLELAGMQAPPCESDASDWRPYEDAAPRAALWCSTIGEAVRDADLVVEAVLENLEVKAAVLAEAAVGASSDVVLATSTLSLPLSTVREAVSCKLDSSKSNIPRIVGLRFLYPVVFVPFVEVTLTAEQQKGEDGEAFMDFLRRCSKTAFICDEGVAQSPDDCLASSFRARHPFRLEGETAKRRQVAEARLRHARCLGSAALAALRPADLFDFQEDGFCCVCLDSSACVTSLLCGHKVMCEACARVILSGTRRCPICRVQFEVAVDATAVRRVKL